MNILSKKEIFYLSNSLSILRLFLIFPLLYFLTGTPEDRYVAVLIGIVAIITDGLDGYFARKYNQITDFGKIIDPLADKILMGAVTFILVYKQMIPVWFLIIILVKDLLILIGGLYMKSKQRSVPQSNLIGKITAGVIALYLLMSILLYPDQELLRNIFLWTSVLFSVVSFFSYASKFLTSVTSQAK